jgi:hypothetical protein
MGNLSSELHLASRGLTKMRLEALCCVIVFLGGCTSADEVGTNEASYNRQIPDPQIEAGSLYASSQFDLNGDGKKEVVVWLEGPIYCGTSGCEINVFENLGDQYRYVGRTHSVKLPVRVLPTSTNGWRDLSAHVSGGGSNPYEARLQFNGTRYPEHPFEPSVVEAPAGSGMVLLGTDTEVSPVFRASPGDG